MEDKYIGMKFNRLTVLEPVEYKSKSGKPCIRYKCKCDCGKFTEVLLSNLTSGKVKSCGCLARELREQKLIAEMVGKKFGRLTVLSKAESRVTSRGKKISIWHCKCDCGNECDVVGTYLRKGKTKSCGCYSIDKHREILFKDLTGMRFGRLTVIDENKDYNKSHTLWNCICDCGNPSIVQASNLLDGHSTSCGCKTRENAHGRYQDLTGEVFGKLTVTAKIGTITKNNGTKVIQWSCLCECKNVTTAYSSDLLNGKKKSCGCSQFERPYRDLTGKRFGRLIVIERVDDKVSNNGRKRAIWRCQCDCGRTCEVYGDGLTSYGAKSCGCIKSYGEFMTRKYLDEHHITYEYQKKFNDLKGVGNRLLSYDFYLPDLNLLIECQGAQHYSPVNYYGGEDFLNKQQEHDKRKREYAELHNIELFEIDYTEYNNIENILQEVLGD